MRMHFPPNGVPLFVRAFAQAMTLALVLMLSTVSARAEDLLVSGASSLAHVLPLIATAFEREHAGLHVKCNFAASGTLQKQIEQGAPVDVFVPAAQQHMDALQQKGLIDVATRRNICSAELVLVAPSGSAIRDWQGLADNAVHRIAIGDPASVPVGMYAMQTLQAQHLWDIVHAKLVFGDNVQQTLAYVEGNNVDAAIVYHTDATKAKYTMIVASAPAGTHDAILYPVAVVARSTQHQLAASFAEFLSGKTAQDIFHSEGFEAAH